MIVSRVYPTADAPIDIDDDASRQALLELYRPEAMSSVRINLIASVSGSVGGSDGTSNTLSNPVDRRILGVIRELGDVVLIGAQSVRAESYVLPRRAPLAIVTSSGDLSGHGIAADASTDRVYVLCPAASADRVKQTLGAVSAEIIEIAADPRGQLSMTDVVTALQVRGFESIVCEGGPRLAAQLLDAGLVDEICLTTSPLLNGSAVPILGRALHEERAVTLLQLLVDDASGIYARWSLRRAQPHAAPSANG
ncbi:pyrimidine reductase family protein [soil metagenome]